MAPKAPQRCPAARRRCVDWGTVAGVALAGVATLAWVGALVFRFAAGDFASPEIKYRWNDDDCSSRAGFVCADAAGALSHHTDRVTWFTARARCIEMGQQLASMHSESDGDQLMNLHQPANDRGDVWIGLNDRGRECGDDGSCFTWADGTELQWTGESGSAARLHVARLSLAVRAAWAEGEPNDWQRNADRRDHAPGPSSSEGSLGEDW